MLEFIRKLMTNNYGNPVGVPVDTGLKQKWKLVNETIKQELSLADETLALKLSFKDEF